MPLLSMLCMFFYFDAAYGAYASAICCHYFVICHTPVAIYASLMLIRHAAAFQRYAARQRGRMVSRCHAIFHYAFRRYCRLRLSIAPFAFALRCRAFSPLMPPFHTCLFAAAYAMPFSPCCPFAAAMLPFMLAYAIIAACCCVPQRYFAMLP